MPSSPRVPSKSVRCKPCDEHDPRRGAVGHGRVGGEFGVGKDLGPKRQPDGHVVEIAATGSEDEQARADLVETTLRVVGLTDDQHPVPLERLATEGPVERNGLRTAIVSAASPRRGSLWHRHRPSKPSSVGRGTRQDPDGTRPPRPRPAGPTITRITTGSDRPSTRATARTQRGQEPLRSLVTRKNGHARRLGSVNRTLLTR